MSYDSMNDIIFLQWYSNWKLRSHSRRLQCIWWIWWWGITNVMFFSIFQICSLLLNLMISVLVKAFLICLSELLKQWSNCSILYKFDLSSSIYFTMTFLIHKSYPYFPFQWCLTAFKMKFSLLCRTWAAFSSPTHSSLFQPYLFLLPPSHYMLYQ